MLLNLIHESLETNAMFEPPRVTELSVSGVLVVGWLFHIYLMSSALLMMLLLSKG
jgi:hypothetical protein